MQTIEKYILDRYDGSDIWFEEEVRQAEHLNRISKVINNREYLSGKHRILTKEDAKWKGKEYVTTKLILQQAKTLLNFHSTYLLGKPLNLMGSKNKVKAYEKIYRDADYSTLDFNILDNVNKYVEIFEYIYWDTEEKTIKSKLIDSTDGFPIFSEDTGDYIAFIEHWTSNSNKVSYYNIYYKDRVEVWDNEGGELQLRDSKLNLTGLPIHWRNSEGISMLEDLKPIFDEMEDMLSKMSDSIYCYSLNPIGVAIGQRIEGTIPSDAVGYALNLDAGEFEFKNAEMDYNTIKLYLGTLQQQLNTIGHMPSVAMGNSNVANVSEVSLKLLYHLADIMAMLNEKWFRKGLKERFKKWDILLNRNNIIFDDSEYIDIEFNYSRPVNQAELLDNLKKQREMGAISIETIIEKSDLTRDKMQELERLKNEVSKADGVDDND